MPSDERQIGINPERRIGINPERRIGNPRPVGRILPVIPASGHGIVSDVRTRIVFDGPAQGDDTVDPPAFFPVSISDSGGGSYKVVLQPGTVGAWNPVTGEDTFALEVPTVNGIPVTADPRPELDVAANEWVSVKILTDPKNQIKEPPTIQVGEADGTHYIPEVGDTTPVDGEYHIKLFKLVVVGDAVTVEPGHLSDVDVVPYLWAGRNEGGGVGRVLWKYDKEVGEYKFRTLNPGYGVDIRESGELIESWFLAENTGAGAAVYTAPDNPAPMDPAKFKTLVAPSGSQLKITSTETEVLVRGNSKNGSISFLSCDDSVPPTTISWEDGLIITEGDLAVQLGDCSGSTTDAPGP
jgi:hypothetical protein